MKPKGIDIATKRSTSQLLRSIPNVPCLKRHEINGNYYAVKKIRSKIKTHALRSESGITITDRKVAERKVQGLAPGEQFAIAQAHGTEVSHTFTGRMMSHNGIFDLRGDPRFASRAVLLKMNLIQSPEIRVRIEA